MYLHKNGCKYYLLVFKNLELETQRILTNNNWTVNDFIVKSETNPLPHLDELLQHSKNIEAHIQSEENVLKALTNKIFQITFTDMKKQATDPQVAALYSLVTDLKQIDYAFSNLSSTVKNALEHVSKSRNDNTAQKEGVERLIDSYKKIIKWLEDIQLNSTQLAKKINSYVISIQKEKELINKEEEVIMDFNKNLMSWF